MTSIGRRSEHVARIRLSCVALVFLGSFALPGCTGGIHRQGEHQILLTGTYGRPIKGETIWHDGEGRAENASVTLGYNYFLKDRGALMVALSPYKLYNQIDGDRYAGEFQMGFRYYFWEFDLADRPVGLYAELLGGLFYAAHSIPEDGSNFNFTQDTGVGFEWQLADNVSWVTGYRFKHLSNGNFSNDSNPAQNDHQVYTGIAITLP